MAVTLAAVSLGACGGNGAFPSKEITMTVPFGSGGSADLLARTLAEPAGTALGQNSWSFPRFHENQGKTARSPRPRPSATAHGEAAGSSSRPHHDLQPAGQQHRDHSLKKEHITPGAELPLFSPVQTGPLNPPLTNRFSLGIILSVTRRVRHSTEEMVRWIR